MAKHLARLALSGLLALALALPPLGWAAPVETYSTVAGDNDSAPPDGFPEGQTPASLNDAAREVMAGIAVMLRQWPWVKLSTGQTVVRDSNTQFTLDGVNLTSIYSVGRRVREVGATTVYGVIATSTFSGGDTVVTVVNDAAAAIPMSLTAVDVAVADANSYQLTAAGKLADALIAQSGVTQHQAALTLGAAQTTSGTFDAARIPNLDASKITTGEFADARISESSVAQYASSFSGVPLDSCESVDPCDFSGLDFVTYAYYEIFYDLEDTSDDTPFVRFNSNSGATDYEWAVVGRDNAGNGVGDNDNSDSEIQLTPSAVRGNAAEPRGTNGLIRIVDTGGRTRITWEASYVTTSSRIATISGAGASTFGGSITSIQLLNMPIGLVRLYGYRNP